MIDPHDSAPQALKAIAGKAIRRAKRYEPEVFRAIYAYRRASVIARLRLLAVWNDAQVEIDIAPDVRFGRDISLTVWPGSKNVVRIGPGCTFGDRFLLFLNDATVDLGDRVEVRRDTVFRLWGGTLELAGENIISWANVIHCAESIRFGRLSSTNEWVTIVDSSHYFTDPDTFFYHNVKTGPIEVGYNTWICSKATLARGARVGDHCIVAGNSVVTGEVPSGMMASGVPAAVVRPVPRPWIAAIDATERAADGDQPRRRRATSPAGTRPRSSRRTQPSPPDDGEAISPDR